jgi:outer membrane protein assembly factor BamB
MSEPTTHPWPSHGGNPAHTGLAAGNTPKPPLRLAWAGTGNGYLYDSPVVAQDRVIIAGRDCVVYCWQAHDGKLLWAHEVEPRGERSDFGIVLENWPTESASCLAGNVVIVPTALGQAHAISIQDGRCVWRQRFIEDTSARVVSDGSLVYASGVKEGDNDYTLMAYRPSSGKLAWSRPVDDDLDPCALSDDLGFAISGRRRQRLVAFSRTDGDMRWSHDFEADLLHSMLIWNELLICGSPRVGLFAFDLDSGHIRWQLGVSEQRVSGPPATDGQRIYIPNNRLFARDLMTGDLIWASEDSQTTYGTGGPTIVGDYAYIGGGERPGIDCYRIADGQRVWSYPTGDMVYSTPAVVAGRLFIGCHDGKLYCFEEDPDGTLD